MTCPPICSANHAPIKCKVGSVIEYGHGTKHTGRVLAIARSPKTGHDFALVGTHTVDLMTGYLKVEFGAAIGPVEWADDVTGKWRRR